MANQLQFRSDDTIFWNEAFSDGSYGAVTISTPTTDSTPNTNCSGVLASNTLTVGSYTGFANGDLILIHQTRNGGDGAGNWQLNKIVSGAASTSWVLAYDLTHNYDTTAQVILLRKTSSYTINDTFTIREWNGSTGGLGVVFSNGLVSGNGTINLKGKGFRGGNGTWSNLGSPGNTDSNTNGTGYTGEGPLGIGLHYDDSIESRQAPTNPGAGQGGGRTRSGSNQGGDGGHLTVGTSYGDGNGGGRGGTVYDLTNASIATLGAGAGGGNDWEHTPIGGKGGKGAGILFVISPSIDFSSMTLIDGRGTDGEVTQAWKGGKGAGGFVVLQGGIINVGTNKILADNGEVYARYSTSVTGTTTPTLVSEQDTSISTTTSTSTSSTSSTSTTTTMSVTTSTSTTSTSSSTSLTTTSTSTTSTSITTTSTSLTTTSTTMTLPFHLDIDRGR